MGVKDDKLTTGATDVAGELQKRIAHTGDIRLRKMFGGYGVFEEDTMFALVDKSGDIFLKTDDSNRKLFEAAGSVKHDRMPYYQIPDDIFADDKLLQEWAVNSITVSRKKK